MADFRNITGLAARQMFRRGEKKGSHTLGWCKAVKQANIVILPQKYARDFSKFSELNPGALPVLYQSKPGEKECAIAENSDITTDLPAYKIWNNGNLEKIVNFVNEYDWSDLITFYTGCSFSFDGLLLANSIPIRSAEQKKQISMYETNISCYTVGPFSTNMVVTMRPVPEHQLSLVTDITSQMDDAHGAPIHIGNPGVILGDRPLEKVSYGEFAVPEEGDVPVFWACGVTNGQALASAKCSFAITHDPGKMYISDTQQPHYDATRCDSDKCIVMKYSEKGQRYSITSIYLKKLLGNLEAIVVEDPGQRGVQHLMTEGDFAKSALALSHASSVALITGFPCQAVIKPPDETDGLPGIYTLAAMLQALRIQVTLIVDRAGLEMNRKIAKMQREAGTLKEEIDIIPYLDETGNKLKIIDTKGKPKYNVILASERAGRTSSGKYRTMKGRDISDRVDPIDEIFEEASQRNDIVTIGIGDGGNELGMGKVFDQVKKYINLGEEIGCTVAADCAIAAGTSNWGCQGLAFALWALRNCKIHGRYVRRATGPEPDLEKELGWAVPTVERERNILEIVEDVGIKDGINPDQRMSVDGMTFDPVHANKVVEMRKAVGLDPLSNVI